MENQTERTDLETRVKGKRGEGDMDGKSNMETYIQFSSVQFSRSVVSDSL